MRFRIGQEGPAPSRSSCGKTAPGSFHGRTWDPAERAGSTGMCDYAGGSYAALRAASISGNGTSQKYFPSDAKHPTLVAMLIAAHVDTHVRSAPLEFLAPTV